MLAKKLSEPNATGISRRETLRTLTVGTGIFAFTGSLFKPRLFAAEPTLLVATPVAENITLLSGAVCNILILNGDDGAVIVDSGVPDAAIATAARISAISPKISTLINTHFHFDHVGGNEALNKLGAQIVAQENCRKRLATEQFNEIFDRRTPPYPKPALPVNTFEKRCELFRNGEQIELISMPPAHTDTDVLVRLHNSNVLHMGDLYFNGMYPFIDFTTGGWIGGMIEAVKLAQPLIGDGTKVIPGHGPIGNSKSVQDYLSFLETVYARFEKFNAEGRTPEEVVAADPTAEFDEALGKGFLDKKKFVQIAYLGLLKHSRTAPRP